MSLLLGKTSCEFVVDRPDARFFWTAYDPLDLASESIDPLGFMAAYISLADRILPGFTTITTVPRYLSMMCAALKQATKGHGAKLETRISERRRWILNQLQLYERAWAVACGLAEGESGIGEKASDGVRGIRAVKRWVRLSSGKENIDLQFALLSNQVRYGGIGAYSTMLESLHLADMKTFTLRPIGEDLGNVFPIGLDQDMNSLSENTKISRQDLFNWGCQVHAGALTTQEGSLIRKALQGGEEAEFDDHTRWTMLLLIRHSGSVEEVTEQHLFVRCMKEFEKNMPLPFDRFGRSSGRILTALIMIDPFERFYQSALYLFDHIRSVATTGGEVDLSECIQNGHGPEAEAISEVRKSGADLISVFQSSTSEQDNLGESRQAIQKSGLLELARAVVKAETSVDILREILNRHLRVQEGKFDLGQPKGPWIRFMPGARVRLTAQRFGIDPSKCPGGWEMVNRHPYRTFGARRFIRLCRIV